MNSDTPRTPSMYEVAARLGNEVDEVRHELAAARATIARLEQEKDALTTDAEMYRYLLKNAPPEGCVVRFFAGGSSIIWGAITEAELAAKEAELQALRQQLDNPEPRPCCGEYQTCGRACTPRGKWLALNGRT